LEPTPEEGRLDLTRAINRGDEDAIERIAERLNKIEQRLSRIEGGLILGGFVITIAAALLSRLV
jgi:archaellum component FlaC